jgi:signal transduction histidine kinase
MRWFAAGAVSLAIVAAALLELRLPLTMMSASLTLLIVSNLVYQSLAQKLDPEKSGLKSIFRLFYVEICTDFLILICLIHLSGGASNLFAFAFVFHIVIASVMTPSLVNYGLAAAASALVGAVAYMECFGVIRHYNLGRFAFFGGANDVYYTTHFVLAFAAVMFTTAYISSELGAMLKRRDEYLLALHNELKAQNEQVRQANDRLIEIDRTKTYFMRMAAHEIRSPISALLSVMNTIIDGYVTDRESIVSMLTVGSGRANDALRLSKDLLALAREKSKDLEPVNLDINKEIIEAVGGFQAAALEKGISIVTELPQYSTRSIFDRESLNLVITNVLDNAIRYSPEHAGPVTVKFDAGAGGELAIEIADHGIGVPDEDGDKIFYEFHRTKNAREHARVGTGLGLTIAKRAAENLGGTLTYTSRIGDGATFRLAWPFIG